MPRHVLWCAIVILMACALAGAQEDATAPAAGASNYATPPPVQANELKPSPPPAGSCSEDVVAHVLADPIGSWERLSVPMVGDASVVASIPDAARELFATYAPVCGAQVGYRNTGGPGTATVAMLTFETPLNALGFFAAQRTKDARRVLLTSAAYRDQGALHVYSGWYYLRVEVTGGEDQALPPDQYLGARLEVRLPQQTAPPRIVRIMPRGWVNAVTVSYAPTDLLGDDLRPMAAGARRVVGAAHVRVRVMEAGDATEARRWYTRLLQQALDHGTAWEVARLGDEAFFAGNGRPAVGMLQDQFVAHLTTDGGRKDAEAIMRLVGTAIRTTRPLPGDAEQGCHTPESSDIPARPQVSSRRPPP